MADITIRIGEKPNIIYGDQELCLKLKSIDDIYVIMKEVSVFVKHFPIKNWVDQTYLFCGSIILGACHEVWFIKTSTDSCDNTYELVVRGEYNHALERHNSNIKTGMLFNLV